MRRSQEVSQYSEESRRRSEALTGAAIGRRPDLAEFSCMRGWPPCSSARERHSPLETLSTWSKERHEAQVSHSGVEDLSGPCRGRAQQTRQRRSIQIFSAEHVKVKEGSRTTQWCWRSYHEQRPHTVVLKASADHTVAEFQRQKTVLRVSATRCCKLPDRGARELLPRTDDQRSTTKWCWRCQRSPRGGKLPQNGTGGREKFQQCNTIGVQVNLGEIRK